MAPFLAWVPTSKGLDYDLEAPWPCHYHGNSRAQTNGPVALTSGQSWGKESEGWNAKINHTFSLILNLRWLSIALGGHGPPRQGIRGPMQLGANLLFPLLHQCPVQYPVSATYLAFIISHPSRHLWGARFGGVGLPHALGRTNSACGSHISGLQIGPGQGPSVSCVTLHSTG